MILESPTHEESKYTANKRIEALKEQIKIYEYRSECIHSDRWWYMAWIVSMKKRIAMYKTI